MCNLCGKNYTMPEYQFSSFKSLDTAEPLDKRRIFTGIASFLRETHGSKLKFKMVNNHSLENCDLFLNSTLGPDPSFSTSKFEIQ